MIFHLSFFQVIKKDGLFWPTDFYPITGTKPKWLIRAEVPLASMGRTFIPRIAVIS